MKALDPNDSKKKVSFNERLFSPSTNYILKDILTPCQFLEKVWISRKLECDKKHMEFILNWDILLIKLTLDNKQMIYKMVLKST